MLTVALLTAVGLAGQKDDPLFAIFEGLIVAAGWAMGRRHRLTPIRRQLERIGEDVHAVHAALTEPPATQPDDDARPHLSVVRLWTTTDQRLSRSAPRSWPSLRRRTGWPKPSSCSPPMSSATSPRLRRYSVTGIASAVRIRT